MSNGGEGKDAEIAEDQRSVTDMPRLSFVPPLKFGDIGAQVLTARNLVSLLDMTDRKTILMYHDEAVALRDWLNKVLA